MKAVAALAVLLASCATPEGRAQEIVVPSTLDRDAITIGSCQSHNRFIDLRRMMIHENRWIDVTGEHGRERVRVSGEHVSFETPDRTVTLDVAEYITGGANLDLNLRLASVEGKFVLFWHENFQDRLYRQGLLEIVGEHLVPLCEGRGGIETSE